MSKGILLLADNITAYLKTRKQLLEREGYQVLTATNPKEVRQTLQNQHIDLAILDIHLLDDADAKDISGLTIAKEIAPGIPKIILTADPKLDYVRQALAPGTDGLSSAVAFLDKAEGINVLLETIENVLSRNIFIVHGRDEGILNTVARFLERLGFRSIIAREQLHQGRTLMDVLENHTKVSFAVVLVTPDDVGRLKSENEEKLRARQNVIFELGYAIGKLGREKVSVLYKEDIEFPSDYAAVLRIPLDSKNDWKLTLAREIKSSGLHVDFSRVV